MLPALLFVVLAVMVNVFATRTVRLGRDSRRKQNIIVTLIWVLPLVGAILSYRLVSRPAKTSTPQKVSAFRLDEEPPVGLQFAGLEPFNVLSNLAQHRPGGTRFPIMDWQALARWADTAKGQADNARAFELGVRAWLLHMKAACKRPLHLYETEHAYVLSPHDNSALLATATYIETTRKRIAQVLAGLAVFEEEEKSILLVLHNEDAYYEYLAAHSPDGESAMSSGVFINAGCPHFVVALADLTAIEPVIAHEMTHSALAHLALPRWLDEGLAVNTEQHLTRVPSLIYTARELRAMHLQYWGAAEMQEFWSGDSFFRTDDGNLLSYELARILVTHLSGDWERFKEYVLHVQQCDAGASAARGKLGVELGALVCALLEQPYSPEWEPMPELWDRAPAPAAAATVAAADKAGHDGPAA